MARYKGGFGIALGLGCLVGMAWFATVQAQQLKQAQMMQPVPTTQPKPPDDPSDFSHALTLPSDTKLQKRMEAAQDFIKDNIKDPKAQTWGEAAKLLQGLLDSPQDVFIQVTRQDANGQSSNHWVSVKTEANRLLGTMPPKGREFYELLSGANAKARLETAKATGDPQILAEVAQKYLYTEAGSEATNLLGTYHLDRGHFVMAALCFERLISRDGVEKLSPTTLLKATLAFRRVGDRVGADQTWKQLTGKSREGVKLGERVVAVADLQALLDKYNVPARELASPYDWAMYGGNASRSAQGNGGAPFMEKKWRQLLITENPTEQWIKQAINSQETRSQPVLATFFPVAATIRTTRPSDPKNFDSPKVEVSLPLLVYRSYWGIHAVNLKNGKLEWEQRSDYSLDRIARDHSKNAILANWINIYLQSNSYFLYENSTLGMLTTDNSRVYAVEDIALPPHPSWLQQWGWNNGWGGAATPPFGPLQDAVNFSKLQAFDLDSGKLVWEIGGRGRSADESDPNNKLYDCYYLGPPLPVAGKLYLLAEKNQELNLLCLDPPKDDRSPPPVAWSQVLAGTRDKMLQDVSRRVRGVSLAYSDGILVCPTNAGAVLGVDLLSRSLVWAYAYREKVKEAVVDDNNPQQRMMRMNGMMNFNPNALNAEWKVSAPVIQDGKVVFTAPDGSSVHCLNLRDGSKLWMAGRKDDLYLGGVYNGKVLLVGKSSCRALDLNDGKEVWSRETGLPSGQGVASGNVYYLPLKSTLQSKEPEVCAIDVATGNLVKHTKSRKGDVPGNLLFYEGDVISQTATEIVAFPQLKVKRDQMNGLIAKNPKDPIGLTERGELSLDDGDLAAAIDDLSTALANNPPPDIEPKARLKLYETLTQYLQNNFEAGEKYLGEYKKLCQVPPDDPSNDDTVKKAKEEELQRKSNYLCLLAKGRENQGRLVEAYEAYLEFASLYGSASTDKQLVNVIDERNVRTSPDVWTQGRIAAMVAKATPEQRQPLEGKIARLWEEVKGSGDRDKLRNFVAAFGSLFAVGREARLQLAEQLAKTGEGADLLEAERHLLLLRQTPDEKQLAARSVETLARLYTQKGLYEDAAECYRILGRDFADTPVRDGKTGKDLLEELPTDKRFWPYLEGPKPIHVSGKIEVREEFRTSAQPRTFVFEPDGDEPAFFQRYRVAVDLGGNTFKLIDRTTGEERWSQQLPSRVNINQFSNYASTVRFPYYVAGHIIVLPVGHIVFGIDPVNRKVLWEKSLTGSSAVPAQSTVVVDPRDNTLTLTYQDGWYLRIGKLGPVEASYVCLLTRDGLVALDPVTGRTLWTRGSVSWRSHLFGDTQHVYVVEMDANNNVSRTFALRAHDGVAVNVPDFGTAYARRIRVTGRTLLTSDTEPKGGPVLRLYDVHTGKDLWKRAFKPNAVLLKTEDPDLVGAVEPDGRLVVIDLKTQKEVLKAGVDAKDIEKVQAVYLLRDDQHFYLAIHGTNDPALNPWGGPWPNVVGGSGLRCVPVNGKLYALQKETGKIRWISESPNQMLVLERLEELPFLLLTSRYAKAVGVGGGNRMQQYGYAVKSIDKRTGKLLYDQPEINNPSQFYALNVDLRAGVIDFVGHNMRVRHLLPGHTLAAATEFDRPGATTQPQLPVTPAAPGLPAGGAVRIRVAPARVLPAPPDAPPPPPAAPIKDPPKDKPAEVKKDK